MKNCAGIRPQNFTPSFVIRSIAGRMYRRLTNRRRQIAFDVFLAHNSKDKRAVENLARRLRQRGLRPWFDKWHLPPRRVFQEELERVLPVARSIAISLGAHGLGDWERMELRVAIDEFVKRGAPVIPVLLPGSDGTDLPSMLKPFSQVRFKSLSDSEGLRNLVWGIRTIV